MLGPVHCGPLARAPLLPKLRGCFAEFLGSASPAGLGVLPLSTCVGLRYGPAASHSGFSRRRPPVLRYFCFAPLQARAYAPALNQCRACSLHRVLLPRHTLFRRVPACSVAAGCRNLHLLPIGCALRPPLRTRLPQGRSALPWKPWTSGLEDSRLHLATHSGILPPRGSTAPCGCGFAAAGMLPYRRALHAPRLRRRVSAPDIFGAGTLGQ